MDISKYRISTLAAFQLAGYADRLNIEQGDVIRIRPNEDIECFLELNGIQATQDNEDILIPNVMGGGADDNTENRTYLLEMISNASLIGANRGMLNSAYRGHSSKISSMSTKGCLDKFRYLGELLEKVEDSYPNVYGLSDDEYNQSVLLAVSAHMATQAFENITQEQHSRYGIIGKASVTAALDRIIFNDVSMNVRTLFHEISRDPHEAFFAPEKSFLQQYDMNLPDFIFLAGEGSVLLGNGYANSGIAYILSSEEWRNFLSSQDYPYKEISVGNGMLAVDTGVIRERYHDVGLDILRTGIAISDDLYHNYLGSHAKRDISSLVRDALWYSGPETIMGRITELTDQIQKQEGCDIEKARSQTIPAFMYEITRDAVSQQYDTEEKRLDAVTRLDSALSRKGISVVRIDEKQPTLTGPDNHVPSI